MRDNLLLSDLELRQHSSSDDWSDKAAALLQQQEDSWEMLRQGYESLASVRTKDFKIAGCTYRVEYNPGRITSSDAKVDEQAIRERACFLCSDNLADAQRGLQYDNDFILLCNPFPIFPEHFTISHVQHLPQEIRTPFPTLLQLTKDLQERYTVFYNGPKSGASAPDHVHVQAGNKGFMLIDDEYETLITSVGEKIADVEGLLMFAVGDFLRRFISIESDNAALVQKAFDLFYTSAQKCFGSDEEPMMNILSSYQEGEWRMMIFSRTKHRPSLFFEEGEKRMLLSPAAVDVGGVVITPIENDFQRITEEHLVQMYNEIMISSHDFEKLKEELSSQLKTLNPEP